MIFDKNIKFYGTYRPYQQRVLDNLVAFLNNEKIHVVAAPGSGKTILGLELIRRLDQPSLILAPSIAIREQWIERFTTGFLSDSSEKDKWISNDLRIKRPIICITYQALYSAFKKIVNKESIEDMDEELQDYSNVEILELLESYEIKTICLDECHHLKSEWWKVLEQLVKKMEGCKLISLTATPPYDSPYNEWQRYISLCGPIDEEIFVPELINDNNLCPHHDYIYFSYPTALEEKSILKSYSNGLKVYHKYKNHPKIVQIAASNEIYRDYDAFKKAYYENEEYYKSLVLFLHENKVKIPFLVKLLVHIEKLTIKHFEILLQHMLFEDQESYIKDDILISIKKEFSALGIVHNRKVNLVHDDRINKTLALSLSKLDSINTIVKSEITSLKDDLKCLILTDYIKIKSKSVIGSNKPLESFGTIPIFEHLRRANINNVKLCCLSGSVCIIPKECVGKLNGEFEISGLSDENYVEVIVNANNRKHIVASITSLLEQGEFNVLVGTKSLLGEGWDSPCINTLIMASFIGSYVLSNQMRGRAIRTDKNNPNKKSNVWHLVCLNPYDYNFSYDYYNLQKRFSTFIGVDLAKNKIENGINRLGLKRIPYTSIEAKKANETMLNQSKDREKVKQAWDNCIAKTKQLNNITKTTIVPIRRLRKEFSFYSALATLILCLAIFPTDYGFYKGLIKYNVDKVIALFISIGLLTLIIYYLIVSLLRFFRLINPRQKLATIGRATLKALKKSNHIESKRVRVKTKHVGFTHLSVYLKNATTYEQNIFSDCICQILGNINQPRYLIALPKRLNHTEFYVVPELFKKNKETVSIFAKCMRRIGPIDVVFAKSQNGKNEVIIAEKIHYFKFKKVEIETKNVLLSSKIKRK